MATGKLTLNLEVTQVRIVFFPVAQYERAGSLSRLSVLGFTVYRRVGDRQRFFGLIDRAASE